MWRRLPFEEHTATELLEGGLTLLDALAEDPRPALRWYRSTDTALVLGRGQRRELLHGGTLPVVGRYSGGGAVLMDPGLLCLDVLLPAGHLWLDGDLGRPFQLVGQGWCAALDHLGVPDVSVHQEPTRSRTRGSERERLLAAVCYATLGRGEVTAGGRKLVGLAQRRRRPGALIQCGLLRRWQPAPLLRALGARHDDPEVLRAATGLDDLLTTPPTDSEVIATVQHALERVEAAA
ncbi:MAG: hypothetical protein GEU74_16000 [Nitriliruptorales bacterium]|nr:hypothetical protein [Nitriliruptorales bacterium]